MDLPAGCGAPECSARAAQALIDVQPDRSIGPWTVVCCTRHLRWSVDWTQENTGLAYHQQFALHRLEAARVGGHWWRLIRASDAVAAAGAVVCERCPEQALYLTAGVDHGVPDKWWPAVLCPGHAAEHAAFNGATLDEGNDQFGVDAMWNGTDWGLPLPGR